MSARNVIGTWGAALRNDDYACALAALGALQARTLAVELPNDVGALALAIAAEFNDGERTPSWRGGLEVPGRRTLLWRGAPPIEPLMLAQAWRKYRATVLQGRHAPRFGLRLDWAPSSAFQLNTVYRWLSSHAVGLDAVVLMEPRTSAQNVRWHWPLRIGMLPCAQTRDPLRAAWERATAAHPWMSELAQCYVVGRARDSCDVLLADSSQLASHLADRASHIRASVVVCLAEPPRARLLARARLEEAEHQLNAAGTALIGRPIGRQFPIWLREFLRELSHDVPVHAAVHYAGQRAGLPPPIVYGDTRLLDQCRILRLAELSDRALRAFTPFSESAEEEGFGVTEIANPVGGGGTSADWMDSRPIEGPTNTQSVRRRARRVSSPTHTQSLAADMRKRAFSSERLDGLQAVQELAKRGQVIEEEQPSRWVQANAWRADAPASAAQALAVGAWNVLGVHIGPSDIDRADAPFPDAEVDFAMPSVSITVQVELAGASLTTFRPEELTAARQGATGSPHSRQRAESVLASGLLKGPLLHRPAPRTRNRKGSIVGLAATEVTLPAVGDSEIAFFGIWLSEAQAAGRISIVCANRILQTAEVLLRGESPGLSEPGVSLTTEATIHGRYDDLTERRDYDVSILQSAVGGRIHLTIQRNGAAKRVSLDALEAPIRFIRRALANAAMTADYSKSILKQSAFRDTLYAIAGNGSSLKQHLHKHCGAEIDAWQRIHLVPATNAFLPLEYLYDGPPPRADANVCPHALDALDVGSCERRSTSKKGARSPCPHQGDAKFMCPMHFWGFRRLIERTGRIDRRSEQPSTREPLVPSKGSYAAVKSMLFAASHRAFQYAAGQRAQSREQQQLIASLRALSPVRKAVDWDQWRSYAKKAPDLLVLVPHTDQERGVEELEIGLGKRLGQHEIGADLCGADGAPQLMVLLGCAAAQVEEDFQPYPERFRDAGVNIVIAPIAPIRGVDAIPIVKQVGKLLAHQLAQREPLAFGELLPLLRRELLRAGHLGVLGIVGFGDGDWLIGGR